VGALVTLILFVPTEGPVTVEGCTSSRDGGAISALVVIRFRNNGSNPVSTLASNAAGSTGGALHAWNSVLVDFGHRLLLLNNSAALDGGAISLEAGSVLTVLDEGCPASICDSLSRGNGQCDPECMTRACNW
jgi:predicted outer membrane repeat protein